MFNSVLRPFKQFRLALWFYNIIVVNGVANYGRLQNSLGHGEHFHIWFLSTLL